MSFVFAFRLLCLASSTKEINRTFYDDEEKIRTLDSLNETLRKCFDELKNAQKSLNKTKQEEETTEKKLEDAKETLKIPPLCSKKSFINLELEDVKNIEINNTIRNLTTEEMLREKINYGKARFITAFSENIGEKHVFPDFDGLFIKKHSPEITFVTALDESHVAKSLAFEATGNMSCSLKSAKISFFSGRKLTGTVFIERNEFDVPYRKNFDAVKFNKIVFEEIKSNGDETSLCFPTFGMCENEQ